MKTQPEAAIIGWRGDVPVIAAAVVGDQLLFFCSHCGGVHMHDRGDERRAARCWRAGSPLQASGYFLKAYAPDVAPRAA